MSRLFEASLTFPLPNARTEVRLNLCSFSNVHKHYPQCVCLYVCVVGVLYLSTSNLGKWMEFLMNTVKLMASTNPGSLLNISNNQSAKIASSHCQPHSSITV